MDCSFDAVLAFTLGEEGGYIADPADPRFTAHHGISLARLRRFLRDPGLDEDAIRHVAWRTVEAIYLSDFWNRTRCDALPAGIDLMVFDHAVNAGADRAGRTLQHAMDLPRELVDGAIGPETLREVAGCEAAALLDALAESQCVGYRRMAAFGLFGTGWLARLDRRRMAARAMMDAVSSG